MAQFEHMKSNPIKAQRERRSNLNAGEEAIKKIRAILNQEKANAGVKPINEGEIRSGENSDFDFQDSQKNQKAKDKTSQAEKYSPAKNFKELIDLLKAAEAKLKAAGLNVNQRIMTLRGIYYGTKWSFDYLKAEGSAMRNLGFTYFLYGPDALFTSNNLFQGITGNSESVEPEAKYVPVNPAQILGASLFNALFNSYEVENEDGRKIDFGHLIIGMEARLAKEEHQEKKELIDARYYQNPISTAKKSMGGTGLELTTWVGDLGGGAAMLAHKRVTNPNTSAQYVFNDEHSFGAPINLEGDIAAFLVGLPEKSTNPYDVRIDANAGIAGAIEKYTSPAITGNEWNKRSKKFLELYGGKFDASDNLTNRSEILLKFADKIRTFAYFYKETRIKDEANKKQSMNNLNEKEIKAIDEQLAKINLLIPKAANEVATLFMSALLNSIKNSDSGITP